MRRVLRIGLIVACALVVATVASAQTSVGRGIASAAPPIPTPVSLANGGTAASLTDPNADRILFWDDSAGVFTWLTAGTGLTITGTTIDAALGLTIGTTTITSGTTARVLFDLAGVVSEDADFTFATDTLTVTNLIPGTSDGVKHTSDNGIETMTGLGGTPEDLVWNLNGSPAANYASLTSTTGVTTIILGNAGNPFLPSIALNVTNLSVQSNPDPSLSNITIGSLNIANWSTEGIAFGVTQKIRLGLDLPTAVSFGTGASLVTGSSDSSGELDVGTITGETSGTVTFGTAFSTAPRCIAQNNTTAGAVVKATASTTVLTITGTFITGDNLVWLCFGPN